jgi:hypothetical protein
VRRYPPSVTIVVVICQIESNIGVTSKVAIVALKGCFPETQAA